MADIPFSSIRRVFERAARLASGGTRVINFGIGRPDFDTPEHIKAAAKQALDDGFVHYTPNSGVPALRQAIAALSGKGWLSSQSTTAAIRLVASRADRDGAPEKLSSDASRRASPNCFLRVLARL